MTRLLAENNATVLSLLHKKENVSILFFQLR